MRLKTDESHGPLSRLAFAKNLNIYPYCGIVCALMVEDSNQQGSCAME